MARVAAEADVPVVVMHNQNGTTYDGDIIREMRAFFIRSLAMADAAGLSRKNIIFDPGIGFGKTAEQNMHVLRRMDELISYDGVDYPVLLGARPQELYRGGTRSACHGAAWRRRGRCVSWGLSAARRLCACMM